MQGKNLWGLDCKFYCYPECLTRMKLVIKMNKNNNDEEREGKNPRSCANFVIMPDNKYKKVFDLIVNLCYNASFILTPFL